MDVPEEVREEEEERGGSSDGERCQSSNECLRVSRSVLPERFMC